MKNMLLLATACLAVASPAFGMDADQEQKTRTITVLFKEDKGSAGIIWASESGITYRYDDTGEGQKMFAFKKKIGSTDCTQATLRVEYTPMPGVNLGRGYAILSRDYEYMIPAGNDDITVEAALKRY